MISLIYLFLFIALLVLFGTNRTHLIPALVLSALIAFIVAPLIVALISAMFTWIEAVVVAFLIALGLGYLVGSFLTHNSSKNRLF